MKVGSDALRALALLGSSPLSFNDMDFFVDDPGSMKTCKRRARACAKKMRQRATGGARVAVLKPATKKSTRRSARTMTPCAYKGKLRTTSEIRMASDCSGIGTEIIAAEMLGLESRVRHCFASDADETVQKILEFNFPRLEKIHDSAGHVFNGSEPVHYYGNTAPCTTFSTAGLQDRVQRKGRGGPKPERHQQQQQHLAAPRRDMQHVCSENAQCPCVSRARKPVCPSIARRVLTMRMARAF